jgi:preprotein translocase subunit SecE
MGIRVEPLTPRTEGTKQSRAGYVRELKEELKKVTWTTKDELAFCTKVVVGATFVFGIGIYLIDLVIKGVLNGFGSFVHLIFG